MAWRLRVLKLKLELRPGFLGVRGLRAHEELGTSEFGAVLRECRIAGNGFSVEKIAESMAFPMGSKASGGYVAVGLLGVGILQEVSSVGSLGV